MRVLIITFFVLGICTGCEEVPVILPVTTNQLDSTYTQNVLIEEYTGVRCQNCPAGAQLLEELKNIHGSRLVIVSIHGGFFAQPTNIENKLKLDNEDGVELIKIFNQPQGYPSSIINRKVFPGQSSRFLGGGSWAGYINEEKNRLPSIGIDLDIQSDEVLKKLTLKCDLTALTVQPVSALNLSVVLVENNIKDAQLGPAGVDTNYIHRHVMRSFTIGLQGKAIEPMKVNEKRTYNFTLAYVAEWKINELSVVAFVHQGSPGHEVLQVVEKKVK